MGERFTLRKLANTKVRSLFWGLGGDLVSFPSFDPQALVQHLP